jgi:hypothetical protein
VTRPAAPKADPAAFDLSPEAEAFVLTLKADRSAEPDAFTAWRQADRSRRLMMWGLGAVLLAPGLVCFLLQLPAWLSAALELAGLFGNLWLRQERRRRLKQIAAFPETS